MLFASNPCGSAGISEPRQTWPYPAALPDILVLVDLLVWFCRVFLHCPTPILILFPPPYLHTNKASPGIPIPSYSNPILPSRTTFLREALLVIHPAPLASTSSSLALRVKPGGYSTATFSVLYFVSPLRLLPPCWQRLCFSFHLYFSPQRAHITD